MLQTRIPHLDELVDDFFASLIRTRPWEKKRAEPVLEDFVAFIEERHGAPAAFAHFTPTTVADYLERDAVEDRAYAEQVITIFTQWAIVQGWLPEERGMM